MKVGSHGDSLAPITHRQVNLFDKGPRGFLQGAVHTLSNTILGGAVTGGELASNAMRDTILSKIKAIEFAPIVNAKLQQLLACLLLK